MNLKTHLNWSRPFRRYGDKELKMLSNSEHRSCWDCEHLRVAGMPARMCVKHPDDHVYAPGPVEHEVRNEGVMGRFGSVADRCLDFETASEFDFALSYEEEEVQ